MLSTLLPWIIGLAAASILAKVCKAIRDIVVTILYVLGLLVAIKYVFKWVIIPVAKGAWVALVWMWRQFQRFCRYLDRHYQYRNVAFKVVPDKPFTFLWNRDYDYYHNN